MNATAKTILIAAGVLVILCVCIPGALLISGMWSFGSILRRADAVSGEDLQSVSKIASEIVDFDLPDGYGSPYGLHVAGFTSVGYLSQGGNTHIFLAQLPENFHMDVQEIMRMIGENPNASRRRWYSGEMTFIEEMPVVVRGQESVLTINESVLGDGESYRVASVTFQGKGGTQALLIVAGATAEWDINMVEGLIASMR